MQEGEALAVFALNALGKRHLTISILTPAFAALFHVGISSEELTRNLKEK